MLSKGALIVPTIYLAIIYRGVGTLTGMTAWGVWYSTACVMDGKSREGGREGSRKALTTPVYLLMVLTCRSSSKRLHGSPLSAYTSVYVSADVVSSLAAVAPLQNTNITTLQTIHTDK